MYSKQLLVLLIVIQQMMLQNVAQIFNNSQSDGNVDGYRRSRQTCLDNKCADYCYGTCGPNSRCEVRDYIPMCICLPGFKGNPRAGCVPILPECQTNEDCLADKICSNSSCTDPCLSACGSNAICDVADHVTSCVCSPGYVGNPRTGCAAVECTKHEQCAESRSCTEGACIDPCHGVCGDNAICRVSHHYPSCVCMDGFTGDPFKGCYKKQKVYFTQTDKKINWYNALTDCQSRGMRLATIQDEEEYNRLVDVIKNSTKSDQEFWLSGSDLGTSGTFIWMSTGSPMSYTKWDKDEPNHGDRDGEVSHCVGLWSRYNYTMYDGLCSYPLYYVCEK